MLLKGKTRRPRAFIMIPLAHIRAPRTFLYILRYPLIARAYYTFDSSLALRLFLSRFSYVYPSFSIGMTSYYTIYHLLHNVLFLIAQVPPLSAHHIHFDFLTSLRPYLSAATDNSLSICRARAPSLASFATPPRPLSLLCNSSFYLSLFSSMPHRARVRPRPFFFYSALSVRMHRVHPSLCLEPRSPVSPFRCIHLFSLLSWLVTSQSPSLSLFTRASRRQSISLTASLSGSAVSTRRIFALHTSWLRLSLSTSLRLRQAIFAPHSSPSPVTPR